MEGEFKFDDLRHSWNEIGPLLDKTITRVEQERAAALAREKSETEATPQAAPAPPPDDSNQP